MFDNQKMTIIKNKGKTTLYITDCKVQAKYTDTPEEIKELREHEIIVFGSNLNGEHNGGLAKKCKEEWGATTGISKGLTGRCYAFPTLNQKMQQLSVDDLKKEVDDLILTANQNTTKIFLVTKIGTGIAGIPEETMKNLFKERNDVSANIILPKQWRNE